MSLACNQTQKTYNVMEVYQNSDAAAAHGKHLTSTDFLKELAQVRKITNVIVFGSPDAQVKEGLARLDPVYTQLRLMGSCDRSRRSGMH